MNELPNKHSAIVNAAANPNQARLDKLDRQVDIANRKAQPLLKQLDRLLIGIDNDYDSRFRKLLVKVLDLGDRYGGFNMNWTSGMKKLHKEMADELRRMK